MKKLLFVSMFGILLGACADGYVPDLCIDMEPGEYIVQLTLNNSESTCPLSVDKNDPYVVQTKMDLAKGDAILECGEHVTDMWQWNPALQCDQITQTTTHTTSFQSSGDSKVIFVCLPDGPGSQQIESGDSCIIVYDVLVKPIESQ